MNRERDVWTLHGGRLVRAEEFEVGNSTQRNGRVRARLDAAIAPGNGHGVIDASQSI